MYAPHRNTIAIKQDMYAPHSNTIAIKQDMYAPHSNTIAILFYGYVLSVLRITVSDYPFGICKVFVSCFKPQLITSYSINDYEARALISI